MKRNVVVILMSLLCIVIWGQDFAKLSSLPLSNASHYKNAEPMVLQCCDFVLGNSVKTDVANRQLAIVFIIKWMEGTPEYNFDIDNTAMQLTDGNKDLLSLYLASFTKIALEDKDGRKSKEVLKEESIHLFVSYCANPDNKVKVNKELKRTIEELTLNDV